ncbi:MAG TPA: alpha/beta hydrolase [Thermoanaerobaculia bacterium]
MARPRIVRLDGPVARLRAALQAPGFRRESLQAGRWRMHHRVSLADPGDDAPAFVLVHGLIVSGRYMMPLAVRLAETHAVLVPDLPGFGGSERPRRPLPVAGQAEALAGYLAAIGRPRVVLVANSFGCQVAARAMAAGAGPVERLVLVGPTIDAAARGVPRQLVRLVASLPREPFEYPVLLVADLARVGLPRAVRAFRVALADRIEESLPQVAVPTLVVRGSRDPIVPRRWGEEVAALLPDGRLAEVDGGGHALNYSRPDELARLVRELAGRGVSPVAIDLTTERGLFDDAV